VVDALSRLPSAAPQRPSPGQPTSPALAAKDWPEEGLASPEQPILAAIADAQLIDFAAMAAAQRSCTEVAEMMNSTTLQTTTQAVGDEPLLGDVSTGVFRPLVPIQHREAVFQPLHAIHHPGVRATRRLIATRFCWPQMAKAITLMARACLHCQRGKVHKHVHLQTVEIPVPPPPFRPHSRRPGQAAASLARPHLSVHHYINGIFSEKTRNEEVDVVWCCINKAQSQAIF
jgi:hypothetical protein